MFEISNSFLSSTIFVTFLQKFPYHLYNLGTQSAVEHVSVFELKSIQIIDCNLAIQLIESKYLKMTEAIRIIDF